MLAGPSLAQIDGRPPEGPKFLRQADGRAQDAPGIGIERRRRDTLRLGRNMFVGGDFGLALGSRQVFVNVAPVLGVKLSEGKFSVGAGPVCQYFRTHVVILDLAGASYRRKAESLVYGARAFGRARLLGRVFAQADAETLSAALPRTDGELVRGWAPGLFAGLGYSLPIRDLAAINLTVAYNLVYREGRSPYAGPVDFRVGIQFR